MCENLACTASFPCNTLQTLKSVTLLWQCTLWQHGQCCDNVTFLWQHCHNIERLQQRSKYCTAFSQFGVLLAKHHGTFRIKPGLFTLAPVGSYVKSSSEKINYKVFAISKLWHCRCVFNASYIPFICREYCNVHKVAIRFESGRSNGISQVSSRGEVRPDLRKVYKLLKYYIGIIFVINN